MEDMIEHKRVSLSGIQATGVFTLGNYLGAIRHWDTMQRDYDCIYFIADGHALTVRQDPKELRTNVQEACALLLACGVDPKRSLAFAQTHVPEHFELAWILSCHTYFGELSRMTQFKDKSAQHEDNINAGLFTYPALMAADILLYQSDVVPVGEDQKQHLEITRDIAQRFNNLYGNTFTIPEPHIPKQGARIMSLADPTAKMSKSDANPRATVSILDEPNVIRKKFRSAVTDSSMEVRFCPGVEGREGVANLLTIYTIATGKTMQEAEREFEGKGYGDFKSAVGESVVALLAPIQKSFKEYMADPAALRNIYADGASRASEIAARTLTKVKNKLGFYL